MFKKILVAMAIVLLTMTLVPTGASGMPDLNERYAEITNSHIYANDRLDLSDDGSRCLSYTSFDEWVGVFSVETEDLIWSTGGTVDNPSYKFSVDMSGDGRHVITADRFGLVNYYEIDDGSAAAWSYNISSPANSASISRQGDEAVVGFDGGVCYFDQDGLVSIYMAPTPISFRAVIANDGGRIMAVAGFDLVIFDGGFDMTDEKEVDLPSVAMSVHLSDDGMTGAVAMNDGSIRFLKFFSLSSQNSHFIDQDFGSGGVYMDMSRDGSAAFVSNDDGFVVFDINLTSVRWSMDTVDQVFGVISGDGSYVALPVYSGGELRLYDGWDGELLQRTSVLDVYSIAISEDGNSIAVWSYGIIIFRPSLEMQVLVGELEVPSDTSEGFWIKVYDNGSPVDGAKVEFFIEGFSGTMTQMDLGNGTYWVLVSPVAIEETQIYSWQATASKQGYINATAEGTLKVIGTSDPENVIVQLEDSNRELSDKIGSLQTLVLISLVAIIVLGLVVVLLLVRRRKA